MIGGKSKSVKQKTAEQAAKLAASAADKLVGYLIDRYNKDPQKFIAQSEQIFNKAVKVASKHDKLVDKALTNMMSGTLPKEKSFEAYFMPAFKEAFQTKMTHTLFTKAPNLAKIIDGFVDIRPQRPEIDIPDREIDYSVVDNVVASQLAPYLNIMQICDPNYQATALNNVKKTFLNFSRSKQEMQRQNLIASGNELLMLLINKEKELFELNAQDQISDAQLKAGIHAIKEHIGVILPILDEAYYMRKVGTESVYTGNKLNLPGNEGAPPLMRFMMMAHQHDAINCFEALAQFPKNAHPGFDINSMFHELGLSITGALCCADSTLSPDFFTVLLAQGAQLQKEDMEFFIRNEEELNFTFGHDAFIDKIFNDVNALSKHTSMISMGAQNQKNLHDMRKGAEQLAKPMFDMMSNFFGGFSEPEPSAAPQAKPSTQKPKIRGLTPQLAKCATGEKKQESKPQSEVEQLKNSWKPNR